MCPESLAYLAEGPEAKVGDTVIIKEFRRGRRRQHRFTMYARTSAPACPICLPDNSTIRFTNLPAAIRQRAEVAADATAVLKNGWAYESFFTFPNGATARMTEMRGATFQVAQPLDAIDREANQIKIEVGIGELVLDEVPVPVGASSNHRSMGGMVGAALVFVLALMAG